MILTARGQLLRADPEKLNPGEAVELRTSGNWAKLDIIVDLQTAQPDGAIDLQARPEDGKIVFGSLPRGTAYISLKGYRKDGSLARQTAPAAVEVLTGKEENL